MCITYSQAQDYYILNIGYINSYTRLHLVVQKREQGFYYCILTIKTGFLLFKYSNAYTGGFIIIYVHTIDKIPNLTLI